MITDGPSGRSPETSMRDLLRQLERRTITPPARPNNPPAPPSPMALPAPLAGPLDHEQAPVVVGEWVLTQDPASGDLIAQHADGTTRTVASRGDT